MTDLVASGFTVFGAPATAALAVLDLHTSDDPLPTGGSSTTSEPAVTPQRRGCGCLPRWLAWTLLLAIGGFGLFTGGCLDACTGTNRIRHVPAIHGRVVDMETGQPLAGVRITRYLVREEFGGLGGGDQSIAHGSWHTATSSADGTFRPPGWWGLMRGISSIKWGEFKPGWTAGWGHIRLDDAPTLDVAKLHLSDTSVQAETRHEGSHSTVILRLRRVNTAAVAEDHFWALAILVREHIVKEEDFVAEALSYSSTHEVSLKLFKTFDSVLVDLGGHHDDRPCYKANLAWIMLGLEERLCKQHSEWRLCTAGGLERSRDFLQRNCPIFRR